MAKRKTIPQSIRFEVFKRDLFTCQYCGLKAPDIILEIDHIIPVSKGGDNSIENLVTACRQCNGGKSNKKLSELSEVEKSRRQLEELQEKKNMVDMIVQWKQGLSSTLDYQVSEIERIFYYECSVEGEIFSDDYKQSLRKYIRKFGFDIMLDATFITVETYVTSNDSKSRNNALNKLPGIAYNRFVEATDPNKASLNKIINTAHKILFIEPRYFYKIFPTNLYRQDQESLILDAIKSARSVNNFIDIIYAIYFGGTNG